MNTSLGELILLGKEGPVERWSRRMIREGLRKSISTVILCETQVSILRLSTGYNWDSLLKSGSIPWGTEETWSLFLLLLQNAIRWWGRGEEGEALRPQLSSVWGNTSSAPAVCSGPGTGAAGWMPSLPRDGWLSPHQLPQDWGDHLQACKFYIRGRRGSQAGRKHQPWQCVRVTAPLRDLDLMGPPLRQLPAPSCSRKKPEIFIVSVVVVSRLQTICLAQLWSFLLSVPVINILYPKRKR